MSKVSTCAEAARQAFKALGDNPETKAVIAWCEANLGMKVHSNDVSRERYRLKLLTESVQATGNNAVVPSTVTTAGPPQLMTTERSAHRNQATGQQGRRLASPGITDWLLQESCRPGLTFQSYSRTMNPVA